MTLNDLLRKAQSLSQQFSTGDITLYNEQTGLEIKDIHLTVEDEYDGTGPYIIVEIRWKNTKSK